MKIKIEFFSRFRLFDVYKSELQCRNKKISLEQVRHHRKNNVLAERRLFPDVCYKGRHFGLETWPLYEEGPSQEIHFIRKDTAFAENGSFRGKMLWNFTWKTELQDHVSNEKYVAGIPTPLENEEELFFQPLEEGYFKNIILYTLYKADHKWNNITFNFYLILRGGYINPSIEIMLMGQLGLGSRSIDWYLNDMFAETPWFLPNSVKSMFDIFGSKDTIIIDFTWPISFVWPRSVVPRKTSNSWDSKKKTAASGVRQGWFCGWGGASMRVVTW